MRRRMIGAAAAILLLGGGSFADRDNTLVVAEDEVSRAMVSVVTDDYARGSGMQVCPGVFLTNAHVVTNPTDDGGVEPVGFDIVPFTGVEGEERWTGIGSARDGITVISPWLDVDGLLDGPGTLRRDHDYAFLMVDPDVADRVLRTWGSPMRSRDHVPLLSIESDLLSEASGDHLLDVYLYRRGGQAEDGGRASLPRRPLQRCDVAPITETRFGHDCPIAGGISGAPLTTEVRGRPFVVGLFYGGVAPNVWNAGTFADQITRHEAIETPKMCADYARACGRPCASLDDLGDASLIADRDAVRDLQTLLAAAGLDPGPADGLWGRRTEAALAAYLRDRAIGGDGEFTIDLWDQLRD